MHTQTNAHTYTNVRARTHARTHTRTHTHTHTHILQKIASNFLLYVCNVCIIYICVSTCKNVWYNILIFTFSKYGEILSCWMGKEKGENNNLSYCIFVALAGWLDQKAEEYQKWGHASYQSYLHILQRAIFFFWPTDWPLLETSCDVIRRLTMHLYLVCSTIELLVRFYPILI